MCIVALSTFMIQNIVRFVFITAVTEGFMLCKSLNLKIFFKYYFIDEQYFSTQIALILPLHK